MPFTKINLSLVYDVQLGQNIAEELHLSLVNTCSVHPDDNFCLISRSENSERIIHPSFMGRRDPTKTVVVEITLLSGRKDSQKEALYTDCRERLEKLGINSSDVIVYLVENSAIDWSFGAEGSVQKVRGF